MTKEVYLTQSKDSIKVCKVQKFIYELKHAYRSWNIHFNEAIKEYGFIQNKNESQVFKKVSGSIVVFLIPYADDILKIRLTCLHFENEDWLSK